MSVLKVRSLFYLYNNHFRFTNIYHGTKAFYCSKIEGTFDKTVNVESKTEKDEKTEKAKEAIVRAVIAKQYKRILQPNIKPCIDATRVLSAADVSKKKGQAAAQPATASEDDLMAAVRKMRARETGTPTGGSGSPRPVRQEPGMVHLCLFPFEWILFFLPKTGVTGFYTFLVTFGTFLISKEYIVLEHNYYNGLSMGILCALSVIYVGPFISKMLDDGIDDYENSWTKGRRDLIDGLNTMVKDEENLQKSAEAQLELVAAKRNNVDLQLESEFRERQMIVYKKVKKYLDYNVEVKNVHVRYQHKNLVQWVMKEVEKGLTPELKERYLAMAYEHVNQLITNMALTT